MKGKFKNKYKGKKTGSIASELVSVVPMSAPRGLLHYLDYTYESSEPTPVILSPQEIKRKEVEEMFKPFIEGVTAWGDNEYSVYKDPEELPKYKFATRRI